MEAAPYCTRAGCSPLNSVIAIMIILSSLLTLGCQDSAERYVPSPAVSVEALRASLEAWKQGIPVGEVPQTKPLVHVTDSHRQSGQVLDSYQILGEVPGNAPRCLAAKLKFSNPSAEERVRFVVIGIDPLWVFRHEDYDLLMHWEHPMEQSDVADSKSVKAIDETP